MKFREGFFGAMLPGNDFNKLCTDLHEKALNAAISDPNLKKKLTPDYPPGCKRIIISDDFFPCLAAENVTLVTEEVTAFTETGLQTKDALQHGPYDLIVLATGFITTDFLHEIEVTGRNGLDIHRTSWAEGAQAYLGVTVENMPNFGMLYGPNTNLGHNSIILMIEEQSRYIVNLASPVIKGTAKCVVVKKNASDKIQHRAASKAQKSCLCVFSMESYCQSTLLISILALPELVQEFCGTCY